MLVTVILADASSSKQPKSMKSSALVGEPKRPQCRWRAPHSLSDYRSVAPVGLIFARRSAIRMSGHPVPIRPRAFALIHVLAHQHHHFGAYQLVCLGH